MANHDRCPEGCPLMAVDANGTNGYSVVLYKLDQVIAAQEKTNGRLRTVEKFTWAIGGGLIVVAQVLAVYAALHSH